jgi:DNA-binding CsgD family transcriptional regulator/PAS domain-containing protein
LPQTLITQWAARYLEHDVWARAGEVKQVYRDGNVVLDAELVSERDFLRSIVYRELLRSAGVGRLCCGIVFGRSSDIPTVCSVFRDISEPKFGEAERRRLSVLVPHLSRAFGVTYRLRDTEFRVATTLSALDRLQAGILLIDDASCVMHENQAARRLLGENDGLTLQTLATGKPGVVRKRLWADNAHARKQIEKALSECVSRDALAVPHFSHGVQVERTSGRRGYVLQFAPLAVKGEFGLHSALVRAIVFITSMEAPVAIDAALLKRLYRLTDAEVAYAARLVAGQSVIDAAAAAGISENTGRTHLRRIFAKTNTHRQADLVRLLLAFHAPQ